MMRVVKVQNNNTIFGAKLNIYGKYFVSEEFAKLTQKANKIGFENDIVELNFVDYRDKSIEFSKDTTLETQKRIIGTLKARFIPNGEGKGTEFYKEKMSADNYPEFWAKENAYSDKYLNRLIEKYPNERIGVSIIEN